MNANPVDVGAGAVTDNTLRVVVAAGGNQPATVTNGSVTTANPGTTFVLLAAGASTSVTISNLTGTSIEVQRGGAGTAFALPTGTVHTFYGITNANQLGVRRVDQSNTQVTISYERNN